MLSQSRSPVITGYKRNGLVLEEKEVLNYSQSPGGTLSSFCRFFGRLMRLVGQVPLCRQLVHSVGPQSVPGPCSQEEWCQRTTY